MKRRAPTGSSKRRSGGSRGRAATRVAARPASKPMPIEDLQRLNQELRVYETELEMQNEALRQTQVELERTRDQYIDLYQLAPIGYMTLDPAGVILDANLAAANLLGLPHTRLVGRRLGSFATRRDEPALARHLVDTFKTGIKQVCEVALRGVDGMRHIVRLEAVAEAAPEARPTRCRAALVDLTEDRRAASHARQLAAAVSDSSDAIMVLDLAGRILTWNRGAEVLYGHPPSEALGRSVLELVPAEHREEVRQWLVDRMVRGEHVTGAESQRVTRDGRRLDVSVTATLLRGEDGEPEAVSTTERDVTAQKRMEGELREREARLSAIINTAADGIVTFDGAGSVKSLNPSAEGMFGRATSDVVDGKVASLFAAGDGERVEEYLRLRLDAGAAPPARSEYELRGLRADGSTFPAHVAIDEMKFSGRIKHCAFVRDLTEDKRRREAQLRSQKLEALGRLAGGISHDYANLFMGLLGCLEVAQKRLDPSSSALPYLKECVAAVQRGAGLCQQLLSFGRPEPVHAKPVVLAKLLAETVGLLKHLVGDKVELRIDAQAKDAVVLADSGQLEQALMNLAANARDAMPNGGTLSIEIAVVSLSEAEARPKDLLSGSYVVLAVRDTGAGMDERTRQRIFEPFFTTKARGTGLGLARVFATVRQVGGHIEVESTVGHGTAFRLYLPQHEAPAAARGARHAAPTTPAHRRRVLVVDDNPQTLSAVRSYLERLGWNVRAVHDPKEAVRLCEDKASEFDLLLTDVIMPEVSGVEVAAALRTKRPDARVLFMSALPGPALLERGQLPPGRLLAKPFDEEMLAAELARGTGKHVAIPGARGGGGGDGPGTEPPAPPPRKTGRTKQN